MAMGNSGRPTVDVIVPNWNGSAVLEPCLDSLARQTYPNVHIVVVDNGSRDDSVERVRKRFGQVQVIEIGHNSGFAAAVNRGIEATSGPFVALLNNDAVASPDWIEQLAGALQADSTLGSAASRMLLMGDPGTINVAGLAFASDLDHCSKALGWGAADSLAFHRAYLVCAPSGGAAMYRRSALQEVGLLDNDYFLYFEDFDLGLRLQIAGYDCLYVPEAVVYHADEAMTARHPEWILRLNRRNSRWTALKCLPISVLAMLSAKNTRALWRATRHEAERLGPEAPPEARQEPSIPILRKRALVQSHRRGPQSRMLRVLLQAQRPYSLRASNSKKTVAIVSHSPNLAGSELCMLRLAKGLRDSHLPPIVILPPGPGLLATELRKENIEIAQVPVAWWASAATDSAGWRNLLALPNATWQTYKVLRDCGVHLVATGSSVSPVGALAARALGVRHVWHVRELYPTKLLRPLVGLRPMLGMIERLSSAIIAPSSRVAAMFQGSSKVHLIPEAIDELYFEAPANSKQGVCRRFAIAEAHPRILVAATLEPAKNQIHVVRALARLIAQGVTASLVLCGNEPHSDYREEVVCEAEQLGVRDRVHLLGFQQNMIPLYDAADVLVVASERESFGLTIVEAMARGVPVVATRCGGPEELVIDGQTGYLIEVGDIQGMADRVGAIVTKPELARRLSEGGRGRAAAYRPEANLASTLASYGLSG